MIKRKTNTFLLVSLPIFVIAIAGCSTYEQVKRIGAEVNRIEQKLDSMIEKPVTISEEEATGIAIKFAGLKKVTTVHQPRVIISHTQTFNVIGNDGKGDILIGIDPSTGEVIKMVKQCPYPGRDTENVVISGEVAIRKARDFLAKRGLPPLPEGFVLAKPGLKSTWRKKHWEVKWHHYVDKVKVLSDFTTFMVNAETGEITAYSKVRHDISVQHQPKLSAEEAVNRARETLGKGNLKDYNPDMKVLETMLEILYPNNYFDDFVYHWSDRQALAWVVRFGEEKEPAIDIWIDALSGQLLGGELYERPVPELWGIPNQTGDITGIWQPALDIMQYNTTTDHTHLDWANEADVIDSIANGNYFIFHTHGNTTSTAEYARLNHTAFPVEERILTPDEIPDNDLRYALMSFCHSAHDGSGQDFKDVFGDRGADVFQGYVESMNPDFYEECLVRYLAEGHTLQNSHLNAYVDASPGFTIVFDYDVPCWNHVRLAPLHVDVSAPGTAWTTATITATVTNREDARYTTAANVKAELQLPAGLAIFSGSNPQTTATLNWANSWTAQWTVVAPFGTFGTKTFDVIVWSDNLGVAVSDYANPYHKFDILFGLLDIVIPEYLEFDKWWEWAVDIYNNFEEPAEILAIIKELTRYNSVDDIQKDADTFIRLMVNMAELEIGFGNHFLEESNFDIDMVKQYLKSVGVKMAYLKQLQEEGFGDLKENLTTLKIMQMKVNAAAIAAFWKK